MHASPLSVHELPVAPMLDSQGCDMSNRPAQPPENNAAIQEAKLSLNQINFYYSAHQSLFNINAKIMKNQVTSFIGPSGC